MWPSIVGSAVFRTIGVVHATEGRDLIPYDFRLTPDSPLIDAGTDPGSADSVPLWPQFEYVHPASGRARQRVAALDLGAYEFCGW